MLLAVGWFTSARRVAAWLLFGWAALQLVGGGILSVLPVPLWPFDPAQTLYHYTFHAIYAVTQIPLLVVVGRWLRQSTR